MIQLATKIPKGKTGYITFSGASKSIVIELRKEYDEDYDEMMYIGLDMEIFHGYFIYSFFNSKGCI